MFKINALLSPHGTNINMLCVFLSVLCQKKKMDQFCNWTHQKQAQKAHDAAQEKTAQCFADVSFHLPLLQLPVPIAHRQTKHPKVGCSMAHQILIQRGAVEGTMISPQPAIFRPS